MQWIVDHIWAINRKVFGWDFANAFDKVLHRVTGRSAWCSTIKY